MTINFLDPSVNPFQTSKIRKLQDFYWASYEDLWNINKMKELWMNDEDIIYCLGNKDKEFAIKSTEWFELREWVMLTERFKKLQKFKRFTLKDTQSIKTLEKYWLNDDDIDFITWREKIVKEIIDNNKVWKKKSDT